MIPKIFSAGEGFGVMVTTATVIGSSNRMYTTANPLFIKATTP